jgi:hypothetical protein
MPRRRSPTVGTKPRPQVATFFNHAVTVFLLSFSCCTECCRVTSSRATGHQPLIRLGPGKPWIVSPDARKETRPKYGSSGFRIIAVARVLLAGVGLGVRHDPVIPGLHAKVVFR